MDSPSSISDASESGASDGAGDLGWSEAVRRFVELAALCGFAIAQPLLSAFGEAPEQFVFRGASSTDIILFALIIALVPPLVLAAITLTVGAVSDRAGRIVHYAALAVLAGLAAIQLGWRTFDLESAPLLIFGLIGGAVVAALLIRTESFRVWLRYTAILPVVAAALFLFSSPTSDLVWSGDVDASTAQIGNPHPIVMLVFDELPTATLVGADGEIDADLFPNFARMSDIGTWFRNNSTNSNNTLVAMPSLLTGRLPDPEDSSLGIRERNLYTLLGNTYDIRADEAPLNLCPQNICGDVATPEGALGNLLADARRAWRSQVSIDDPGSAQFDLLEETEVEYPADAGSQTTADGFASAFAESDRLVATSLGRVESFIEAIQPSATPTLNYLHLQVPHGPFRFYANGVEYWRPDGAHDALTRYGVRGESQIPADVHRQRHVLSTQFADALLGQVLDRLEDQDLLEESIVVIASDHGIAFNPGVTSRLSSEETYTADSIDDVFWSALFMKGPGQLEGGTSDAPTELTDVMPTLIDWIDADTTWESDGQPVDEVGDDETRTLCRPVADDLTAIGADCIEIDGTVVLDEMLRSAVGNFLPPDDSDLRAYRTGPFGSLVGQPLDAVDVGEPVDQELSIRGFDRFAAVTSGEPIPGLVSGTLASAEGGVHLAFVLNGTIAALTESYDGEGATGLVQAILPRTAFVPGANDLQVYVVDGPPEAPVLHAAVAVAG